MTIAQQLKIKSFPFIIRDDKGNEIYGEGSNGFWRRREYDAEGKEIYYENSKGYWSKREYNDQGNVIYYENSNDFWEKREYNAQGNQIYFEDSDGKIVDNRPKTELTMDEIAAKFNIPVTQLKIKK